VDAYRTLLGAVIDHLESLRKEGVRSVAVAPETLRELVAPRRPATPSIPVQAPAPAPRGRVSEPAPAQPTVQAPAGPRLSPTAAAAAASRWARAAASSSSSSARPLPPKLDPAAKAAAFAELRQSVLACVKCTHLVAARQSVVFGVGDVNARLMFVGEAPGADEDAKGEPFVGKAGELLTKIISAMGLGREQVFIANILKCRPDTPGQMSGNRKPTPEEMAVCQPWLERQFDIIQPEVIVALGATAVEGLVGKANAAITRTRGQWLAYRGIPLMPTFHPAYLLRNQAQSEKRKVWEDMLAVMERLKLPISEKQRAYFLKP
jgi:uracil-DNA glycosylase